MEVLHPEDEIHVWLIDIKRLEDLRQLADQNYLFSSILTDVERKEVINYSETSRERFLFRKAAQRLILQAYTGIAAKDLAFERVPDREKPILGRFQNLRNISFNMSHTGDFVAIAVSLGDQLGVDLEQTTRKISDSKISQISRAYFCEEESRLLADSEHAEERRNRFFMIWTIKEAMLKATGEGFRRPLKSFSILSEESGEEETKTHSSSAWASRFNLETFYATPSLVGAVAYVKCNSSRKKLVFKSFSVDWLASANPLHGYMKSGSSSLDIR